MIIKNKIHFRPENMLYLTAAAVFIFAAGYVSIYAITPLFVLKKSLLSPAAALAVSSSRIFEVYLRQNYFLNNFETFTLFTRLAGGVLPAILFIAAAAERPTGEKPPTISCSIFLFTGFFQALHFWNAAKLASVDIYFLSFLAANIIFLMACTTLLKNLLKNRNAQSTFIFKFALYTWLAWCAFPTFKEITVE